MESSASNSDEPQKGPAPSPAPSQGKAEGAFTSWINRHSAFCFCTFALLVMALSSAVRLLRLDWDQVSLLHPDERFIVYVIDSIKAAPVWRHYFDTDRSALNPHTMGYPQYVYGTFPLILIRELTLFFTDGGKYAGLLPSRWLSAAAGIGTVLITMLSARLLFGGAVAVLTGWLLSLCVLHLQLSRFGTFDSLGTFLVSLTFYVLVRISRSDSRRNSLKLSAAAGVLAALAAATKLNLGLIILCLPAALLMRPPRFSRLAAGTALAAIAAVVTFRIAQPYAFSGPGFFGVGLNQQWLDALEQLRILSSPSVMFPPSLQWSSLEPLFALKNMVLWGLGAPLGVFACIGMIRALLVLYRKQHLSSLLPVLWVAIGFTAYGILPASPTMRYQLPYYPMILMCAASFFCALASGLFSRERKQLKNLRMLLSGFGAASILCGSLWAVAFWQIYRRPHSRAQALQWFVDHVVEPHKNSPDNASKIKVLYESKWDDAFPLWMPRFSPYESIVDQRVVEIPRLEPYDQDSQAKVRRFASSLSQADYFIITSNRQWGVVGKLASLYPPTSR